MKVFLFPGQGSQEVGMGADLFKADGTFRQWIAMTSEIVGEDLESVCLRGPQRKLMETRLLQPLLVAVSLGYQRHLTERGVEADMVLGHSLGEVSALAAAGALTPEDAVRVAAKRGELMHAAAAQVEGGMLAVTLEDRGRLLDWLASDPAGQRVVVANHNAPTQVVLSGERSALAACAESIVAGKIGRCRVLPVSGPWHSPWMRQAAADWDEWLRHIPLQVPRKPMLFNVTAGRAETIDDLRACLSSALAHPVRWAECMAAVGALRPGWLLEVGPGGVLSALARANGIGDATRIVRVNNLRGVDLAVAGVAGGATDACPHPPPLLASGG